MPKTIQEFIEWLNANQTTDLGKLPDADWEIIDKWRESLAANTDPRYNLANPRQMLAIITLARDILGDEILSDIQRTFDEF